MQRFYPAGRRFFASVKDSKSYQAVKEFLAIHPTYIQHTRYSPEGAQNEGYRYPAPGSRQVPVIPTTEDLDRYYKTDIVEHDSRELGKDIHVVLSEGMKKLPEDIRMDYIKEYSLKANDDKVFEYKELEVKKSDLDLWFTMDQNKIDQIIFKEYPTQVPHPFWELEAGEIIADYEAKGLPPCPGKMYQWHAPKEAEEGLW